MKNENAVTNHPLFSREIRPIRNWSEWLELWEKATTIEEMIGLLHIGFSVSFQRHYGLDDGKEYDYIDRVIFYLGIADGWGFCDLLKKQEDDETFKYGFGRDNMGRIQEKSLHELRQIVALKAFDALCLNFFKPELHIDKHRQDFQDYWAENIINERLFPVLLNFFRVEKNWIGRYEIRNLDCREGTSHNVKHAIEFLLNVAQFFGEWSEEEIKSYYKEDEENKIKKQNLAMRARIEGAEPWMIEVLAALGELDKLSRPHVLKLSDRSLDKLKEIALRAELNPTYYQVKERRLVANIDEACYLDSDAAWLLKRHELLKREHGRLMKIQDAEETRKSAEREIRELTTN